VKALPPRSDGVSTVETEAVDARLTDTAAAAAADDDKDEDECADEDAK
jgi:hypothetical protein